jgi:hypothetical protein
VPAESFAPSRARGAVPGLGQHIQVRAAWFGLERSHQEPAQLELMTHALNTDAGVSRTDPEGGDHFGPGHLAGDLPPPQRCQFLVVTVQPPGGLGDLPPLVGQAEPEQRDVGELGIRIRDLGGVVQRTRPVPFLLPGP